MSGLTPPFLADVAPGTPLLFVSAHLDDAVLSCGGLMAEVTPRHPLAVVTAFTECGPPPHTLAARRYLRQCEAPDAHELYESRRREDRDVLEGLGARVEHLGLRDAMFRRREVRSAVARVGCLVPEAVHRYPTYRLDIAKGRVSRGDRRLAAELDGRVSALARDMAAGVVFCPVGVGRHVDHLLARGAGNECGRQGGRVVFYSDFPYNLWAGVDAAFIRRHGLEPWAWDGGVTERERLIRGYVTQVEALFSDGTIPAVPEVYYAAA